MAQELALLDSAMVANLTLISTTSHWLKGSQSTEGCE
jgi:hypothetical protein